MAGLLALGLFLVEPLFIAALQGPIASLLDELPVFLGEAAVTIAFTTTAGWALTSWLKLGRWVFPLLAAGWLACVFVPAMLADVYPAASLLNFMFMRQGVSFYSELWGRMVYGAQPLWFNVFYSGMLLLTMALLALSQQLSRFRRPFRWVWGLLTLALVLAVAGGSRYVSGVQAALNQFPEGPFPQDPPAFSVTDYDIALDLSDPQLPGFSVQLIVLNTSASELQELVFSLNPTLAVFDTSLPVEREGRLLRVLLTEPLEPEARQLVTLHYEGALRLESVSEGVVAASDFIEPRGVRLTPQADWYPVPAGLGDTPALHDPARIHLAVKSNGKMHFAANLPAVGKDEFAAEEAGWIFLIGSPRLVVEQADDVTLITSRGDLAGARQFADVFAGCLHAITPFFPKAPVSGLILMVLGEESGLPENTPPVPGYPVVVTQRYSLVHLADNSDNLLSFILRALTADLWHLSGGELDPMSGQHTGLNFAFDRVVSFLRVYIEANGYPVQMQSRVQSVQPPLDPDPALKALVEVYHQRGQEGVDEVLRRMMTHADELRELTYEAIPNWILERAGVAP